MFFMFRGRQRQEGDFSSPCCSSIRTIFFFLVVIAFHSNKNTSFSNAYKGSDFEEERFRQKGENKMYMYILEKTFVKGDFQFIVDSSISNPLTPLLYNFVKMKS